MTLFWPHPTQPAEAASSRLRPFGRNNDRFRSSSGSIAAIGWEFQKALSASGCAGTTGQRLAPAPLQAESLLPDDVKSTSAAGSIAAVTRSHSAPTVPSASTRSIGHRVPPQMVAAPKRAESSRVRSRLGTRKPLRNGALATQRSSAPSARTPLPGRQPRADLAMPRPKYPACRTSSRHIVNLSPPADAPLGVAARSRRPLLLDTRYPFSASLTSSATDS